MGKLVDINCEYLGIPRLLLMENAGREIARHLIDYKKIAVFSGLGNNGGDGLVAARHLSGIGKKVRVYSLNGDRTDENRKNFDILKNLGLEIRVIGDSTDCETIVDELAEFDAIVDALIGVGIRGGLREPVRSVVETINKSKAFKLSVDVPTGGEELHVNADLVLSLDEQKSPDARVVDIGIPREAKIYCGPGDVIASIPERTGGEHKGMFGRLLVVGGSRNFTGTPYLVATAAMRAGVDLAVIACPGYVAEKIPYNPNLIVVPLDSDYHLREQDIPKIMSLDFDVLVIGNGIGLEDETGDAVRELLKKVEKPVIVDADALKLIGKKRLRAGMVLTPHSFEFEKLFGEYDEEKRVELVERYAKKTDTTIVLKGAIDVISDGRRTKLNRTGNPAMTVGGTGDSLAGIIGALLAQNRDAFPSASAGAFLNGMAGDLAFGELGISLTATDVIDRIPAAIKFCRSFE